MLLDLSITIAMNCSTTNSPNVQNIFAEHGVNESGRAELVKPNVSRDQLLPPIANFSPYLIGMEACSGTHHSARLFRVHGNTAKLMAPKFVTPYRMSGKIKHRCGFHIQPQRGSVCSGAKEKYHITRCDPRAFDPRALLQDVTPALCFAQSRLSAGLAFLFIANQKQRYLVNKFFYYISE